MVAPLAAAAGTLLCLSFTRILYAQADRLSVLINFQPGSSSLPADYTKDTGAPYSSERGYGWVREDSLSSATPTAIGIWPNTRDRKVKGLDPRLNTLMHMDYPPGGSDPDAVKVPVAWEYKLPNGSYSVQLTVGDPSYFDSEHSINIEGVPALSQFAPTAAQPFKQVLVKAEVSDGKLTLDSIGGTNTKINTVEIASRPGFNSVSWSSVAPSPITRSEAQGGFAGGKLYVLGGYLDLSLITTKRSDVYDPATNTWKRIADMPTSITHGGTAIVGTNIYVAGGYIGYPDTSQVFGTKEVWKYDTVADKWTAMPPLPQARGSGALVALGRELHFFSGTDVNRIDKNDHWILKLDGGNSWTTSTPAPIPRSHMGYVALGGKIYTIGGQKSFDTNLDAQDAVHVWQPEKPNSWTQLASLPERTSHISSSTFVMDNRIIVIGGQLNNSTPYNTVWAYDPLDDTWETLNPFPVTRHSGVAGSHKGVIYYATGQMQTTVYKGVPATAQTSAFLYDPSVLDDRQEHPSAGH
ncbi:Kelch repeat-containing protein [Gloeobacter morelensis]|nr:kelch repeat-containing protein [Gloeobacter morelensis]